MSLLRLDKVSLNFGTHILLDEVDFQIAKGQRVGLLGRNGAGKTTLMKIIAGTTLPDSGDRWLRPGTPVAWLEQSLPEAGSETVYDVVAEGLSDIGKLLKRYYHLTSLGNAASFAELEQIQAKLELNDGWNLSTKVDAIIDRLQLPAGETMSDLSGGWRKRVALARALVKEPELLLLDEPTNHLDIPAIEWLEQALQDFKGAMLLVTHDRHFLKKVANEIAEIDRGKLFQFAGTYERFLRFREEQLAAEESANKLFDRKLAEEEIWIRQGIKARRTRNEGRVRALESMREERRQRRNQQGKASFEASQGQRSGKLVADLTGVSRRFGNNEIIKNLSATVMRGDRIGLIGVNGAGKSTLLKLLLGDLEPSEGIIKLGTKLEIAYFDQLREHLNLEKDLIDNVCGGQDFIEINGKRKHAITYLNDFLFTPDRVRTPAGALSGGEQNRAILAKLFSKPANILVLDEPTNDLDIETLELLEEILISFKGTVLVVSHDRQFMDNTVTSVMVFTGSGRVETYVGGYTDWIASGGSLLRIQDKEQSATKKKGIVEKDGPQTKKAERRNDSNKKKELERVMRQIDKLEIQYQKLEAEMGKEGFYDSGQSRVDTVLTQVAENRSKLNDAYAAWEAMEQEE
ncbi:MAG TPA: ABC transporter ATP-binding protein [Gammaproteobacteria bacterium]|nr:ABC transporter ATP-binding protein [Gammaproteobacteria bacterium]|tara:strand:- start:4303 stop:6195 length:1893 start_codon:yes stop_codon:yes gene_type:complete